MQSPELALELRSARPATSPELRERVRAVAARVQAPPARWWFPSLGRAALAGAAAVVAVGVGFAAIHGLTHSGAGTKAASQRHATSSAGGSSAGKVQQPQTFAQSGASATDALRAPAALPYSASRLQQYGASLRVQVDDREALSNATKRAMRVARLLGGYVASVHYSAPRRGVGAATVVVRVPIDRVQDAIDEYAALGTLLRQKLTITDVTKAVQEQAREIARLRAEIARLEAGGVTPTERPQLEAAKARLDYLTKRRKATVRRAQLARISLGLTAKPKHAAAPSGRFERTLDDAAGVLLRELEILVYALIVAGPLLLLGIAAIAASRGVQRRRDAHLLERS
jgi:Domain of unknown function (DUF4349)